ncbi:MAG: choice-of-anchor tandem repeat GloVer-containing protein [Candidatus Cybelea sp.]
MESLGLGRFALAIGAAAALLNGCGAAQPPIAQPQTAPLAARADGTHYQVVYSFGAVPDGNAATSSLIHVGGTLYGTTEYGGANACRGGGCGTVFSITTSGTEQVLYSFASRPDGNNPYAGLTDVAGTLYGTTRFGGAYRCADSGCGAVFSISPSGEEKVLHSLSFGTDGHYPRASLIAVKSTLYGTTPGGPAHRYGTVFSITTSGAAENVLHTFKKEKGPRGSSPLAALTDIKGTLYGTASLGGAYGDGAGAYGDGVVFSITPNGTETVLHSFDGTDGAYPEASLVDVKGTFYGTTAFGGTNNGGIVFSITTGGTEKVLHRFKGSDGARPVGSLIDVKGTLYGTTEYGGGYSCDTSLHCGTIFSIKPSGTEKVLHSFGSGSDGKYPTAGLTDVNGTLYGTTSAGGQYGNGTVFALTP